MNERNDKNKIQYAIFLDKITLVDAVFNRKLQINGREFSFGYATIKIRKECKCYFAIQVEKNLINELDEKIIYELMGDTPFFMEYNDDSILYLRSKIASNFISKFKENLLLNILEKR